MNLPVVEDLNIPELVNSISGLMTNGRLQISNNGFAYLDVHDDYIHRLFPLLANQQIKKPDYFGTESVGAHVSVIYPEEDILMDSEDLNETHEFKIIGAFAVEICLKKYYALMVDAPSLLSLRRKYGLSDMLLFKGYWIGFHITIGVQPLYGK